MTEEERRLKKAIVEVKVSGINNVNEYIEAERKRINTFIEEVDYVLSESNATTIIEF